MTNIFTKAVQGPTTPLLREPPRDGLASIFHNAKSARYSEYFASCHSVPKPYALVRRCHDAELKSREATWNREE
ncbi:hypothetical protein LTR28_006891 [Elasticomyces elasticus]|nr:hypothetical protein LTR28_006891 [Elasticomyces elasticus]